MNEPKVLTLVCRNTFLTMFRRKSIRLTPDGRPLKVVARQILLEDGTIVQLKS